MGEYGLPGPRPAPDALIGPAALASPEAVEVLIGPALRAAAVGVARRGGPGPAGSADEVAAAVTARIAPVLPEEGVGAPAALAELSTALTEFGVDPRHPWCTAHLHTPPLAVAVGADAVASMVNPSLDSWDQAPSANVIESLVTDAVARAVYPDAVAPDCVVTTGGTDSTLTGLLLAREHLRGRGDVRIVCAANAHHSVSRAAWMLGMRPPVVVPAVDGRADVAAMAAVLPGLGDAVVVVATAGTTDCGVVDALADIAELGRRHGAWVHVDASYGGLGVFGGERLRGLLAGMDRADSVALDFHKLGWQPVAAGMLAVRDQRRLAPLAMQADYLNADDDTEAGLPDTLGRSWRTSRRVDAFKIAATFRALGRRGLATLVDRCCATAADLAEQIARRPGLCLWGRPELSTVLFRPSVCDELGPYGDELIAELRRTLLTDGRAVLGRATMPDGAGRDEVWLKLTVLHPHATAGDYTGLLDLVGTRAADLADQLVRPAR